jgi:hypothetical protein
MLPAWATVVITLGTALIAASATFFATTRAAREQRLQAQQASAEARRSQLRDWRKDSATEFALRCQGAWSAVSYLVRRAQDGQPRDEDGERRASWLVNEVPQCSGPLLMVFDAELEADVDGVIQSLQHANAAIARGSAEQAATALERAQESRRALDTKVRAAVAADDFIGVSPLSS